MNMKLVQILIIVILVNFITSCSSSTSIELKRPASVPQKAKWFEEKQQWVYEEGNGTATFWYADGVKESQFRVVNDKLEGLFISWYENGNKKMECTYKNDKFHGEWRFWWSNGKLKAIGNYIDDKLDGLWKAYDENGNLIQETLYKKGELISEKDYRKDKKEK